MNKLFLTILLLAPVLLPAQEKGIHFEHGLSWQEVQAKAKTEHKYIFMDCFTTWCGPCKYMSANIFPLEEVGNYFNQHYISVKVQLDSTATDNEEVKNWYQSGHDIATKYAIRAYPTYLFFDENGKAVHRAVGSSDAPAFLSKASNAKNPEYQYYTLLDQFAAGKKDSGFLHKMVQVAMDAYDIGNAKKILPLYLATQPDLYTKTNLGLLLELTENSKDPGFDMMQQKPEKFDEVFGKGVAKTSIQNIIMQEEVFNKLKASPKETPDWNTIAAAATKKYPVYGSEAVEKAKLRWYQRNKDWNNFQASVTTYMKKYGSDISPSELNDFAWTVFQNCKDMTCVSEALEWSKRSFEKNQDPGFIDTYANILYKMGKTDEAIQWETKALSLAAEGDKKGYQETIDKMKKAEKTWND
jgi:thioredoxin-related protein